MLCALARLWFLLNGWRKRFRCGALGSRWIRTFVLILPNRNVGRRFYLRRALPDWEHMGLPNLAGSAPITKGRLRSACWLN
jgi:hypothetical protein